MNLQEKHHMGTGGVCVCPKCEQRIPHTRGKPCQEMRCPDCRVKMVREGSYHHNLIKKKKANDGERVSP